MSSNTEWSLGGPPPEPQFMPAPTEEEARAIRDEVDKLRESERKKVEAAVARGKAKAKADEKAKADQGAKPE